MVPWYWTNRAWKPKKLVSITSIPIVSSKAFFRPISWISLYDSVLPSFFIAHISFCTFDFLFCSLIELKYDKLEAGIVGRWNMYKLWLQHIRDSLGPGGRLRGPRLCVGSVCVYIHPTEAASQTYNRSPTDTKGPDSVRYDIRLRQTTPFPQPRHWKKLKTNLGALRVGCIVV